MKEIYVFGIFSHEPYSACDITGYAVDRLVEEDSVTKLNVITGHWSTSEPWCKHDMGITSDWKHDIYNELYPNGYELVWLGCFGSDKEAYDVVVERFNA